MLLWIGGHPGLPEILIILLVIMLLFGAKRLPGLARSLGKSINEFKRGRQEGVLEEGEPASSEKTGEQEEPEKQAAETPRDT